MAETPRQWRAESQAIPREFKMQLDTGKVSEQVSYNSIWNLFTQIFPVSKLGVKCIYNNFSNFSNSFSFSRCQRRCIPTCLDDTKYNLQ